MDSFSPTNTVSVPVLGLETIFEGLGLAAAPGWATSVLGSCMTKTPLGDFSGRRSDHQRKVVIAPETLIQPIRQFGLYLVRHLIPFPDIAIATSQLDVIRPVCPALRQRYLVVDVSFTVNTAAA